MRTRRWSSISDGATFEALVKTLVAFEDSNATLFGRRGKDGGQDARSSDGRMIYQAKHHIDESAAKAIADAKSELAKIVEYKKPTHLRFQQWANITQWHLMTNCVFNPTDDERWEKEVVPLLYRLHDW